MFWVDMVQTFFIPIRKDGRLVKNHAEIAREYARPSKNTCPVTGRALFRASSRGCRQHIRTLQISAEAVVVSSSFAPPPA